MVEFELGHARTGASDVARERINQKILARTVQAELLGDLGRFEKSVPGELVDMRRGGAGSRGRRRRGEVGKAMNGMGRGVRSPPPRRRA